MGKAPKIIITITAIALTTLLLATANITIQASIQSNGRITAIGVTIEPPTVNWGKIPVGENTTQVFKITNNGTEPLTLTITTSNWKPPEAEQYIIISWKSENTIIQPNQSKLVYITLQTDKNTPKTITDFSNNIIITGSET